MAESGRGWKQGSSDKPSHAAGDSKPAKASWRGAAQEQGKAGQYRWQDDWTKKSDQEHQSRTWRHRAKIATLSLLGIALIAAFIAAVWFWTPKTPFIAAAAMDYTMPIPPNAWAQEDIERFSQLHGDTITFAELTGPWESKEKWLERFDEEYARAAGTKSKTIILYLSLHGVVADGEPHFIPPQASPWNKSEWLPVADLLQRIQSHSKGASKNKLLIVDSNRIDADLHLGILYNTFTERLEQLVEKMAVPRLAILNSTAAGQRGWASPELAGSVFGFYAYQGLAGAANGSGFGDNNKRVTLRELERYVRVQVSQWVAETRADVQTPKLILPPGASDLDFELANIASKITVPDPTKPVETKEEAKGKPEGKPAADSSQPSRIIAELDRLWQRRDKVLEHEIAERNPYRFDPLAWAMLEQTLLRVEQLAAAGKAYQQQAESSLRDADQLLDLIEERTPKAYVERDLPTLSLPLTRRFQPQAIDETQMTALVASFSGESSEVEKPAAYETRTAAAWNHLLAKASPDALAGALRFIGERRLGPPAVEHHVLAMFDQFLDRTAWESQRAPGGNYVSEAFRLRDLAERAATPFDERAHYWVKQLVDQGDAARRRAEDKLFLSSPIKATSHAELWSAIRENQSAAQSLYDRATSLTSAGIDSTGQLPPTVENALALCDRAWAELPYFTIWLTRRMSADRSATASALDQQISDVLLPAIVHTSDLFSRLGTPATDDDATLSFASVHSQLERLLDSLRDRLQQELPDKPGGSDTYKLRDLSDALALPIISAAQRREFRAEYARIAAKLGVDAQRKLAAADRRLADEPASAADTSRLLDRTVSYPSHPAIALVVSEPPTRAPAKETGEKLELVEHEQDSLRATLESVGSVRWQDEQVRNVLADSSSTLETIRTNLNRSQAAARRAAVFKATWPGLDADPVRMLRLLDVFHLLAWHGQRSLDDFWGPPKGTNEPFAISAAQQYSAALEELGKELFPNREGPIAAHAAELVRLREERKEAGFDVVPEALTDDEDEELIVHKTTARPKGNLPQGEATYFVRKSNQQTAALRAIDGNAERERLPLSVDTGTTAEPPIDYRLRRSDLLDSSLQSTLVYRGHQFAKKIDFVTTEGVLVDFVRPSFGDPSVTVVGPRQSGFVTLILDCSYSMNEQAPDSEGKPQRRWDVVRDSYRKILDSLAEAGRYQVSVWFYGHRMGFYRTGALHRMEKAAKYEELLGRPIPPDLRPGEDVEQVLPMTRFDRREAKKVIDLLEVIEPLGETPLYYSIIKAVDDELSQRGAGSAKSIVVLTDGKDERTNDTTSRRAKKEAWENKDKPNVIKTCKNEGVMVYFVGLDLAEPAAERDLTEIANETRGKYFSAKNPDSLLSALKQSLGLGKYAIRNVPDSGEFLEQDIGRQTVVRSPLRRKPRDKYSIEIDSVIPSVRDKLTASLELEGGEAVNIRMVEQGGNLALQYQGLDDGLFQATKVLPDPQAQGDSYWVGLQPPDWKESSVFRVAFQNADKKTFTPRIAEAWVHIKPLLPGGVGTGYAYPFYDLRFQAAQPIPVLECTVPDWPAEATKAEVQLWFRPRRPTEPTTRVPVRDLLAPQAKPFRPSGVEGVTVDAIIKPGSETDHRIVVTERHPQGTPNLYTLKAEISPPPKRAKHRFSPNSDLVIHTFYFDSSTNAADLRDHMLSLTPHEAIANGAITWTVQLNMPPRKPKQ